MKKTIFTVFFLAVFTVAMTAQAADMWDKAKAVPYSYAGYKADVDKKRGRLTVRIAHVAKNKKGVLEAAVPPDLSREAAAATVISAAKRYVMKTGLKSVYVVLDAQPDGWGTTIANASYVNGEWRVTAAPAYTAEEMEISRHWMQMRENFQKNGRTDEDALSAAIAKKMKLKSVELPFHMEETVPADFIPLVAAQTGLEEKR